MKSEGDGVSMKKLGLHVRSLSSSAIVGGGGGEEGVGN